MQVTIKNPKNYTETEVYKRDPATYNAIEKELRFEVNVSSIKKCWRLVHWNGKVKDLFESEGFTYTINYLFCGTKEKCLEEIKRLKLKEDICQHLTERE